MATSPLNTWRWHLSRFFLVSPATSCCLVAVNVFKGMPVKTSLGVEYITGCLLLNP